MNVIFRTRHNTFDGFGGFAGLYKCNGTEFHFNGKIRRTNRQINNALNATWTVRLLTILMEERKHMSPSIQILRRFLLHSFSGVFLLVILANPWCVSDSQVATVFSEQCLG